jgi:hypothetical protein
MIQCRWLSLRGRVECTWPLDSLSVPGIWGTNRTNPTAPLKMKAACYSELSEKQRTSTRKYHPNAGLCSAYQLTACVELYARSVVRVTNFFFPMARQPPFGGLGRLIIEASRSHSDTPHSVVLLWTSDQLVAETSTWQHTTLTRDRHPCPRWDSNPRSQ